MTTTYASTIVSAALAALLAGTAGAEWPDDPSENLAVADGPSDQVQLKVAAGASGDVYVSWFDGIANGFDVRLQRLDAAGDEQWPHNGVLVADRSFSSTQDYDLAVDAAGNAILVFRDDRSGSVQITAAAVDPAGNQIWGERGVQLTSGSAFFAAPKVAVTSDGAIVAAWTQDAAVGAQRLDADGAPQWSPAATLTDAGGSSLSPSDMVAADDGAVLIALVRYGSFSDPRHLVAQKLDAEGDPAWPAPTAVFDAGSLQFGNFPEIVADGAGGAIFAWYSSSPSLQCFVQHVLADGTEKLVHGGVAVSTEALRLRVSPSAAYLPEDDAIVAFWTETNNLQSQDGLYGQKVASDGMRQWSDAGTAIVPVGQHDISFVRTLATADGATVGWIDSLGVGNDVILASRVDLSGDPVWAAEIVDVSSVPSDKSRLAATALAGGATVYAWHDDRNDAADGFVQNVRADGMLGPADCVADTNADGAVDVDDLLNVLLDWGSDGAKHGGDVDGSGLVDVDDLVAVLVAWGPCPE